MEAAAVGVMLVVQMVVLEEDKLQIVAMPLILRHKLVEHIMLDMVILVE